MAKRHLRTLSIQSAYVCPKCGYLRENTLTEEEQREIKEKIVKADDYFLHGATLCHRCGAVCEVYPDRINGILCDQKEVAVLECDLETLWKWRKGFTGRPPKKSLLLEYGLMTENE